MKTIKGIQVVPRGGVRPGSGRKPGTSGINAQLREMLTNGDVETAVKTLRYAMRQKGKNLKSAVEAAKYVFDQKAGKAPQTVDVGGNVKTLIVEVGPYHKHD